MHNSLTFVNELAVSFAAVSFSLAWATARWLPDSRSARLFNKALLFLRRDSWLDCTSFNLLLREGRRAAWALSPATDSTSLSSMWGSVRDNCEVGVKDECEVGVRDECEVGVRDVCEVGVRGGCEG